MCRNLPFSRLHLPNLQHFCYTVHSGMSFEASLPTPSGSSPFSYPLPHPDASATPPKPRPPHTPEQSKKLNDLIDHFNDPHFAPPTTLKGLKSIWKLQSGGSSRFGSFFRGSGDDDQVSPHTRLVLSLTHWSALLLSLAASFGTTGRCGEVLLEQRGISTVPSRHKVGL